MIDVHPPRPRWFRSYMCQVFLDFPAKYKSEMLTQTWLRDEISWNCQNMLFSSLRGAYSRRHFQSNSRFFQPRWRPSTKSVDCSRAVTWSTEVVEPINISIETKKHSYFNKNKNHKNTREILEYQLFELYYVLFVNLILNIFMRFSFDKRSYAIHLKITWFPFKLFLILTVL